MSKGSKLLRALPIIIVGIGILLILIGLLQGDFMEAFRKGATLCLDCIGLG